MAFAFNVWIHGGLAPPGARASWRDGQLRVSLSRELLAAVAGEESTRRLLELFGRVAPDDIQLRVADAANSRGGPHGIAVHRDQGCSRTMQVALNGAEEFEGGRLVFMDSAAGMLEQATSRGRSAGDVTIHDGTIPHYVTPLTSGVRYGLFFVVMPRLRMAAFRIHRFWRDVCYNPAFAHARKRLCGKLAA